MNVRLLPRGIRGRLYLLIALAALPALALLGGMHYQRYQSRRAAALQTELEVAQGVATTFTTYVDGVRRQLDMVGHAIVAFLPYTDAKAEFLLRTALDRYPAIRSMNWIDPGGVVMASSRPENIGRDLSSRPHFQQLLADRPWVLSDLTAGGVITGDPTLAVGVAIWDNTLLRGMVVASIEPMHLGELMLAQDRPAGGTYTLFDSQGVVVYCHLTEPLTWEQRVHWQESDPALRRVMKTGRAHVGVTRLDVPENEWILARMPIGDTGWVAGASRPADTALAPVWRGLFQDASLVLGIVFLAFLLAYLLARTIAEPLRRLQYDAQVMSQGRIDTQGDRQAPAEVRSLRDTVTAMASTLIHRAEELRTIFEVAPIGVGQVDPITGKLVHVNEYGYQITGYSREEMLSMDLHDLTYPDDREADWEKYQRMLRGETAVYDNEKRYVRKDGRIIWVHVIARAIRDAEGKPVRAIGVLQDITDRKRAEEALQRSEQRFRKLFEADLMGVYITKPDGTFIDCNNALVKMLGYGSREEVLRYRSTDFYVDPKFREEAVRVLQRDGIYPGKEGLLRRKDGTILHALGFAVLLRDDQTGEPYIQGVAVDITERKHVEEALRDLTTTLETKVAQRTEELEHRTRQLQKLAMELSQAEDRERKRLAEILHDDLQQQLAAVKFHLGLLSNRVKQDPSLRDAAAQLNGMIKDAIEKSRRLSHELSPAVLHHGDLAEMLRWLASQIRAKHGLNVRVDADGQIHADSEGLSTFVYRAAQEMLFNVVKHARVEEARIHVRRMGHYICLSVSDRGRGFDPQELQATSGFGLLSIRERAEFLGGRMRIRSAQGKGSTFWLVVPDREPDLELESECPVSLQEPAQAAAPDGQSEIVEPQFHEARSRLRVLIVDDHKIVRQGLTALLDEERDIEVAGEAADGREAISEARRLRPDVVIMDMSMPVMDGDEAARQIKKDLPQTRIIALSMFQEEEVVQRMRRAGVETYVLKTAPTEELLAAIRGARAYA